AQPVALDRLLHPELWGALLHTEFPEFSATMFQPVGGMDRITDAFYQRLTEQVQLGAQVRRIRQREDGIAVTYHDSHSGREQVVRADYLVSTLPLPLLARLDTDFSDPIKAALLSTRNDQATKVAWQSPRFWETDYRTYGGLSWIDHPARLLWYPSNDLNTRDGLLVAGYVTGEGADVFGAKPFDAQYATSREAVELLHPGYSHHLRNPLAVSWEQIPYSEGPWLQREHFPADASALLEAPHGRDPYAPAGTPAAYGNTEVQTVSVFNKLRRILQQQDLDLGDIVQLRVFLVGAEETGGKLDFAGLQAGYTQFFGTTEQPLKPALTALQVVALPLPGALIEVEAVAARSA
ncbi:FAD-dependent oxidoreductase, partial [Pseudomonas syringae]